MLTTQTPATCHHLFAHPATDADHDALTDDLAYFRSIGDGAGILIAVARLTGAAACRSQLTGAAR
ncbi:hypothetical protein [Kitasatospora sp. NPDC087315]|uniref:hypothetical protein n=1 Tax=Kitasatospora sp. NPDC087315 TaxID=3364069 RepID=UPI00382F59BE